MKILIFGGTGAMGAPLVERLAARGDEVYVTSRQIRKNQLERIHYLQGDAHDMNFLENILKDHYDVLVDFMCYTLAEFVGRISLLLDSVGQYIFLSSCRVYAPSKGIITEKSPRLLEVCQDKEYLATEEYALTKAREEDAIYASKNNNWTIVRPTVTYNSHRLQLGCYEMEDWLYRAMNGRPVVFFEDLMNIKTPMTYGGDVARAIAMLIGNPAALGETVQVATPETMTWKEIIELYFDELISSGEYGGGYSADRYATFRRNYRNHLRKKMAA